ncbi:hypothetical protein UFOVP189_32 [uncultured Caudovirales phage]|uniref:Uncharacterized protein n=1 Tax=uncultured Caudovirales phage TaxID=2100421 RepID=A0A6J7WG06_9CAUD|nr:hypothetical protein UFOVP189_32 [uncultured Caudovirales phage]
MTPTTKLRFVERKVSVPYKHYADAVEIKIVHILQQWWISPHQPHAGAWRDVPIEKESK